MLIWKPKTYREGRGGWGVEKRKGGREGDGGGGYSRTSEPPKNPQNQNQLNYKKKKN